MALRAAQGPKQASVGRTATKVAGYMAATQSSTKQKNSQPIRKRTRENTATNSVGSDFVSVVRASVASNAAASNVVAPEKIIKSQSGIHNQLNAMTSRHQRQS